ncbi:hypothetical protein EYF80_018829 [Liparis tanakae]|uniref:Uncharacterized protein n=1 Tax=Liparis tanakae TaxID=230148 RepID=A0A4Z2I1B1_9TELE|nr:hypothetical protein EYF80_018829 [Liparis tanakae]
MRLRKGHYDEEAIARPHGDMATLACPRSFHVSTVVPVALQTGPVLPSVSLIAHVLTSAPTRSPPHQSLASGFRQTKNFSVHSSLSRSGLAAIPCAVLRLRLLYSVARMRRTFAKNQSGVILAVRVNLMLDGSTGPWVTAEEVLLLAILSERQGDRGRQAADQKPKEHWSEQTLGISPGGALAGPVLQLHHIV